MVIMDTPEGIGSLEEEAHKRKQRLKNLKRKNSSSDKPVNDSSGEIVPLPKPKFRSYKPQDESLKEAKLEDAIPAAVEDEVKDLLEAGKEKPKGMPLKKDEVMHLLNLVECNPIIYSKTTNATSNKLKDAAWLKITYLFNSTINSHPRKPEQLRLKWENLKKNARRRSSNINANNLKTGIPDYIQPDEVLDKVTAILGPSPEILYRQYASQLGDIQAVEADDMRTVIVIPSPSDSEEITDAIDCVEVDVGGLAEGEPCCTSDTHNITNTFKEPKIDDHKRAYAHRTSSSGKLLHQNILAKEVESRINRNNAIADYYIAKKMKIDEEIMLNREKILLEKKKIELEILELENRDIVDKDKILLKKKRIDLEILELQSKKYISSSSLLRGSADDE